MTNTEPILEVLDQFEDGLCDDCLAEMASVRPRQQVIQICRRLAHGGHVLRERGICSSDKKRKIVNRLPTIEDAPEPAFPAKRARQVTTLLGLVAFQRRIVTILDDIEGRKGRREEGTSARIGRLVEAGRLAGNIAIVMRTLNSYRDLLVHEGYELTHSETKLLQIAATFIDGWVEREGERLSSQAPTVVKNPARSRPERNREKF